MSTIALADSDSGADADRRTKFAGGGFVGLLWLTWRQHRWTLVGAVVVAAVLTAWMAYLAADMTSLYHQCHNKSCQEGTSQYAALNGAFGPIKVTSYLLGAVEFLPLIGGLFLGIPLLAREHEQRTIVLAWSQDVSPARWLWTKLALLGAVVAALTAVVSAEADHLAHVRSTVDDSSMFNGLAFLVSGMVPLALGVSWFAVGVALGAATRRTLPAAAAALAAFIALFAVVQWRYPYFMKPLHHFSTIQVGPLVKAGMGPTRISHNALIVDPGGRFDIGSHANGIYDASGHPMSATALSKICPIDSAPDFLPCAAQHHLQTMSTYQPGSRIPDFHLILIGGYLGIGALALLAAWLLVRRTSLSIG